MRHLREVCDKHGIMLVVDEVQTGFFRTGKYFALNHTPDIRPDIMVFAKGVANGFPLSGVAASKELMKTLDAGSLGGTYAGNAVACAAGVAAQDVFATQDIGGNVAARSAQLYSGMHALAEKHKNIFCEVRGQGVSPALFHFVVMP
jgi:4-aminobutyrate aminotransferase